MKSFIISLFIFILSTTSSQAGLIREQRKNTFSLSIGSPSPSYIGAKVSVQSTSMIEFSLMYGIAWPDSLIVNTLALESRIYILPFNFTPIIGAGASFFFLSGQGSFQGLESSIPLGTLLLGIDWAIDEVKRLSIGYRLHYPVQLGFPFVEFGYTF